MSEDNVDNTNEEEGYIPEDEPTNEDFVEVQEAVRSTDSRFNPFPGLRPFKINESHLFFGREGQSDEVLLKLSKNRFVGVIGPSGSGKSSFVYCGVLPILYGGFLTDVSAEWEVVVTRPGAGPIDNLAEALLTTDLAYREADIEEKKLKKTIISTLLRSSSLGLVESIGQFKKSSNKNYLILVDQFEELFRFKDSREAGAVDETLAFINLLLEAVDHQDSPIYVGITMRSDFIGDCAQFADLTKKINDSHYLIPQMTREQKRKAVEGPVAVGGAEISSRLVQRLLNDLGDNPDQLPILQHSLMRTWDYWQKYKDAADEELDIKHYEAIGTMSEALSLHANEAYDELNDEQKHICESLFKAITERRGENFGIRRPTRLGDIAAIAHASARDVAQVLEKFRQPGRSLLIPPVGITLTPKSVVDISHESLMRIWVRLKNWVEDEAEAVSMYQRLAGAASMYQLGKAGLWRPPDLQLALNWESKHKPTLIWAQRYHPAFERTMEFLTHSKKEFETEQRIKELQAKRRLKTARITAMVMAALCVVAIGFLLFAFDQKTQADLNAEEARTASKLAEAQTVIAVDALDSARRASDFAELKRLEAEAAKLAALMSADTARMERDSATLARQYADLQRQAAVIAQRQALDSAEVAKNERANALAFANEARIQRDSATTQKYQAIAKSIALKSVDFKGEAFAQIKGLLAQQAYIFNTEWGGYEYDGDVYNGLYFALKEFEDDLTHTSDNVYHSPGNIYMISSRRNNTVYSVHENGKIFSWIDSQKQLVQDSVPNTTIKAASLSKDGKFIAIGGKNAQGAFARVINLASPASSQSISGLGDGVIDIVYHDINSLYILDNHGESIKEYRNGVAREIFDAGSKTHSKLTEIDVSSDTRYLFGVSIDGKLHRWDLTKNYEEKILFDGASRIESLSIGEDGKVAIGDSRGVLVLLEGDGTSRLLAGHRASIDAISFSFDGKFLATGSLDRTVRLWNLEDINKDPIKLDDHNAYVTDMVFTSDNSKIMASTHNRAVKVWPTKIEQMSTLLCPRLPEPMLMEDWLRYVGPGIPYEQTCEKAESLNSGGQQ